MLQPRKQFEGGWNICVMAQGFMHPSTEVCLVSNVSSWTSYECLCSGHGLGGIVVVVYECHPSRVSTHFAG
jgi:hypothetical protein